MVAATGCAPLVAGKPYAPLIEESVERVGAQRPLIVGDRLDTDIEAGQRCGIATLLVMTGVTDVATLLTAVPSQRPTFVAADLRGLLAPAAHVAVPEPGDSAAAGPLAALRGACRAAWAAADSGVPHRLTGSALDVLVDEVHQALAR